ncbi:nucleotidyl transferase AbiEii/AbiGii toxin family protein [Desulfonatronovibrio magnus]|uniref:nucleotidyl transferase AbiEii/AbiGii toxin family protein n=1 Tax=Desulfonatronovibrio magnus TaxID=698827 RepID=UPI000698CBEE|nr:nucleotidyl transferase AbiEii/AbiGii toxin family protein [Desulfonatronovibrio magnus]
MQKDSLTLLKKVACKLLSSGILPKDSYLAGGTAAYFYLNHRISVDLDFFSEFNFVSEKLFFHLQQCFDKVFLEVMEDASIIAFLTENKIKFSMFHLPYSPVKDLYSYNLEPGVNCPLASLEDIAAMKSIAIAQRGSAKDFFDLFCIIKHININFDNIFNLVKNKYSIDDNYMYHLKTSFVFFDDAEEEAKSIITLDDKNNPQMLTHQFWNEIKHFYKEYVK